MAEYTVTIKGYNKTTSTEVTLYFSTNGYTSGPADTPANQYYEPLLKNPGVFTFQMYSDGKLSGPAATGVGAVILINNIGQLDYLLNYALDGRVMEIAEITPQGLAPFLIGTMEQPLPSLDQVSIRIRDRKVELDVPFQPTKYAGNNALPAGLEGVEDIKGKPKPRLYGVCYNVAPVMVNTSRLICQLSDIALFSIDNVYDRGVALTKGTDYTDQADMEANAPAAGYFRAWPAGGFFRLGSSPAGQLTADATQGAAAANRTVAQIVKQIVQIPIAAADCVEQGFIDLDKVNASVVGIYVSSETTYATVIDELCASVGAWYGFENMGKFCIRRLELAGAFAITKINDAKILNIELLATNDTGRGVPAFQVNLNYAKNYTPQTSDLAGGVTDVRRQWLKRPYRTVKSTDATVKVPHLLSPEVNVNTVLTTEAAAQTESDRILTLQKTRRDYLKVTVPRTQLLYDTAGYWDDEAISEMSVTRSTHTCAVYENYLYVIGGLVNASSPSVSVIRLDLNILTGSWDDVGVTDLPATRYSHTSVIYGNFLYVIGGTVGGSASTSVIRLDLTSPTGAWDDAGVTDLPATRSQHSAIVYGTYLYVFGGLVSGSNSTSVIRLDLSNPTGAWDDAGVTNLPQGRRLFATALYGVYAYVFGGVGATTSVIRLDLSSPTGAWDDAGVTDLPAARSMHSAIVRDNYVYIIGSDPNSAITIRLDLDYPASAWDDGGVVNLREIRSLTALAQHDKNILVVGGKTTTNKSNTYLFRSNDNPNDLAYVWTRNKVVKLETNRFGYNSSKYMRIAGAEVNLSDNTIALYLWG